MPEAAKDIAGSLGELELKQISDLLHQLCQPLTTLQCRLEMAELVGTVEAYRQAIALGMEDCGRLVEAVNAMREVVRAAKAAAEETAAAGGRTTYR